MCCYQCWHILKLISCVYSSCSNRHILQFASLLDLFVLSSRENSLRLLHFWHFHRNHVAAQAPVDSRRSIVCFFLVGGFVVDCLTRDRNSVLSLAGCVRAECLEVRCERCNNPVSSLTWIWVLAVLNFSRIFLWSLLLTSWGKNVDLLLRYAINILDIDWCYVTHNESRPFSQASLAQITKLASFELFRSLKREAWTELLAQTFVFRRHENNWNVRQQQNWMEWRKFIRERILREFHRRLRVFL